MNSLRPYVNVLLGLWFGLAVGCTSSPRLSAGDQAAIRTVLQTQQHAWNAGDIPAFMEGYWRSDSLTFVGGRGVTYGWQATLEGYLQRYPDRTAMGQLTFGVEYLQGLGPGAAMLVGTWHLDRTNDQLGGYFTLTWRKIDGQWLIVSDHTSSSS